jgi:hypothetical protein
MRMTTLDEVAGLAAKEHGLVVVSTARADGTIQSSLVNAGVMRHPMTDQPVLAFVTYGKVKRLFELDRAVSGFWVSRRAWRLGPVTS